MPAGFFSPACLFFPVSFFARRILPAGLFPVGLLSVGFSACRAFFVGFFPSGFLWPGFFPGQAVSGAFCFRADFGGRCGSGAAAEVLFRQSAGARLPGKKYTQKNEMYLTYSLKLLLLVHSLIINKEVLSITQLRRTKQKQLIMDVVQARHDHPTADQIYLAVRAIDGHISRGTVYRNLQQLSDTGRLLHVKVPGPDRYDSRLELHYHMVCKKCGAVMDAPLAYQPRMDAEVQAATGFAVERHRTIFEGLCLRCQTENRDAGAEQHISFGLYGAQSNRK